MESKNLEQLLESLIIMVGKSNQKVDSLQKRVSQLEWLIRENHLEIREKGPVHTYPHHLQKHPESIPYL